MSDQDCPAPEILQALVARTLTSEERDRVLAHADGCNECHAAIEALHQTDPAETVPDDDQPRSHRLVAEGTAIGRYRIERPIGIGGMGVVYVAHDPELDRKVAVKLLRRGASDSIERLRREGRALAALTHPNVVAVHDVGEHDDELFIAMEFVDGSNLRGWLTAKRRSWREVVEVALAVGRGLEAAHIAGLVHRDIKPDNILLGRDGRIRIGDFGLVNELPSAGPVGDLDLTQTGALLGTPAYMAPEQLDGGEVDARSDQWSFCATVFEALYGVRAFAGKSVDELSLAIEDGEIAETRSAGVPRWLRRILVRGLAVEPRKRWPSMRALCDAIERSRRRRKLLLVLAPIALAALGAGGIWLETRPTPVDCSHAGDVPMSAWNMVRRAAIAVANPDVLPPAEHWLASWSDARADACRVNVADDVLRARRERCLDHEAAWFGKLVAGWETTPDNEVFVDVEDLEQLFPSITRCTQDAVASQPEPTPDQLAVLDKVEDEMLHALEARRAGEVGAVVKVGKQALVEAGTYAPAIISVAVKLAAYQKPSMEEADLRTTLRTALAAAETSRDDGVKAAMSLKLVGALAEPATADEARHFLDYAKAAVARLPASRRLAADVAYAEAMLAGVSDMSASIEPRRRASELRIAEFGERSREARATMRSLAAALESTSPEEAGRLLARLDAIDAEDSVPGSKEALGKRSGKLLEDAIRLVFANDLDGAIRAMSESAEITERVTPGAEGLPVTYQQVATLELFALHYEPALAHFNKAIAMWDKRDVRSPLLAASLYNAATAARELERLDEAIALARRGIAIGTELHDGNATTLSRAELGRSLVDAGDMTGGRDELDKVVIELAKSAGTSVRATSKFALAVAIWGGSAADHTRALDLGRGARAELADLMARQTTQFGQIQLMTMKRELARIDKWLQTHH